MKKGVCKKARGRGWGGGHCRIKKRLSDFDSLRPFVKLQYSIIDLEINESFGSQASVVEIFLSIESSET